jgi:drug/metabolite transporter (DMT)-like permease
LVLAFTAIYVIWGSTYLAIRYTVETIPPLVGPCIRDFVAGAILFGWALARGYRPKREHWTAGTVLGLLFFLVGHWALNWAEQTVPSGIAALLTATEPMFILVFGRWAGQQRINFLSALGLITGGFGVWLLTISELSSRCTLLPGLGVVVLAAVSWAAGVTLSPRLHCRATRLRGRRCRSFVAQWCYNSQQLSQAICSDYSGQQLPFALPSGSDIWPASVP